MRKETKPARVPGTFGDDNFLGDITKPAKKTAPAVIVSEALASESTLQGRSDKRQPSRVSKHHVSLYVDPAVDRAFKRLALDQERKAWEVYHDALRQYLDGHGYKFDELMTGKV